MKIVGVFLSLGLFLASMNASAIVITDQIEEYTSPSNGFFSSVDFYTFSSSGGVVTFDIFEWGYGSNYLDSMVWLFNDNGSLDAGDLLYQNDDSFLNGFGDGTTTFLDSWLSASVSAGNYIFAVGQCCNYGAIDIVDGIQSGVPDDLLGSRITEIYDYQITATGAFDNFRLRDATSVPEPASIALFALGLAGLAFSRKKKKA